MGNMRLATATRNALADAFKTLLDAGTPPGTIEIRSGVQSVSANDIATGTLLATLTFANPSFGAAVAGTVTAGAIVQDAAADADGTATWARIKNAAGGTIFDCDVGATGSGATIELNTTSIVTGGPVSLTSFTITVPSGEA